MVGSSLPVWNTIDVITMLLPLISSKRFTSFWGRQEAARACASRHLGDIDVGEEECVLTR